MYFESSKKELDDLRCKIKILKKVNKNVAASFNDTLKSIKSFDINIYKNLCNIKFNENESLKNVNLFTSIDEMQVVENCFRKSVELVNSYSNANKAKRKEHLDKKHTSNKMNTVDGYDKMNNLQFNISHKSKKYDNKILPEYEDANISSTTHNSNNSVKKVKERENKIVKNSDALLRTFSSSSESYNKLKIKKKKSCVKNTCFDSSKSDLNIKKILNNISNAEEEPDIIYLDTVNSQLCDPNHVEIITTNHEKNKFHSFCHKNDNSVFVGKKSENLHLNLTEEQDIYLTDEETEGIIIQEWDFAEEPVDFPVPLLHINENLYSKTLPTYRESDFTSYKTWSKEEVALLIRNYNDFATKFGINDPRLLLGIGRRSFYNKNEAKNVKKFIKAKHFYARLGKDINNRSLLQIYNKAREIFDPVNKKQSKFIDINFLFNLQKKYGNNWILISRKLGQPPNRCLKLYEKYMNTSGKWTEEETKKLIHAVKITTKEANLSNRHINKIPWSKVAQLVGRPSSQCWNKWYLDKSLLNKSNSVFPRWNKKYSTKLIYFLKNQVFVNYEYDINWKQIYESFKLIVPSVYYLKKKWERIKSGIPDKSKKNYPELINVLYVKYNCKEFDEV